MSDLHAELAGGTRITCKVCAYMATLAPSEQAAWQAELRLPVNLISNAAVVAALHRREVAVTEASVRRHRENHARLR